MEVVGLKNTEKLLKNIPKKALPDVNKAIHKAGFVVEDEVKNSIAGRRSEPTSVDTGRFVNSIQTDNSKFMESRVFSTVPYSKYLEFGTSRIRARKHFQNSLNRKRSDILDLIRSAIKKAVR